MKMGNTPKMRRLASLVAGGVALGLSSQAGLAQDEPEFEVAQIYLELNDTDGDLGIHGLIDGEAWKSLEIEGPGDQELMNVWLRTGLRKQGLTEFFFESAEPPFDELSPATFLQRFRPGIYEIEAVSLDGVEFEEEARLSHVLAGPPGNIRVNGKPAASSCDGDLPVVSAPVTIDWDPVTTSHPTIGTPGVAVEVMQYQFVCEIEREGRVPEELVFSVDLPRSRTKFTCPAEFTALSLDGEVKYEIITKLSNNNQTAVESCFELE
jgi:hypothetical protein